MERDARRGSFLGLDIKLNCLCLISCHAVRMYACKCVSCVHI